MISSVCVPASDYHVQNDQDTANIACWTWPVRIQYSAVVSLSQV